MRNIAFALIVSGALLSAPAAYAKPVAGFEAGYTSTTVACTLPAGSEADCRAALTALIASYVVIDPNTNAPVVAQDTAATSFAEMRQEVFAVNAPNPTFQAAIDAIFEELLPDSGAIGGPAVGGLPGNLGTGGDGNGGGTSTGTPTGPVPSPT